MDKQLSKAIETNWDYIIIGTGMGGSVLGLSLAKAGHKVLFCEKGLALEKLDDKGSFPELNDFKTDLKAYQKLGRRFASIADLSYKVPRIFKPFIGEGAGGSSLLYGMAMERGQQEDFRAWPIDYDQLKPFYEEAEALFGVGTSKTLHPQNEIIFDFLETKGLHPYKLPLSSSFKPDCSGCQGHLCHHQSKNHAGNSALKEALKYPNTMLLDECEVLTLVENINIVKKVMIRKNCLILSLKGKHFVLAAGALESPRILFRSQSSKHPNGLANSSNQKRILFLLNVLPSKLPLMIFIICLQVKVVPYNHLEICHP